MGLLANKGVRHRICLYGRGGRQVRRRASSVNSIAPALGLESVDLSRTELGDFVAAMNAL